jgi:transposase
MRKRKNKRTFTIVQRNEIRHKLAKEHKKIRDPKAYKRLLALRMYGMGKSNKEISGAVDFSVPYITELVTKYLNDGINAIITDKRTSNNRRMSIEEETLFLEQFIEMSEAGKLVTAKVILEKFEKITGKPSATSTIYDLLKRHGWRKLQPRPCHPGQASPGEIAKWCWQKTEKQEGQA